MQETTGQQIEVLPPSTAVAMHTAEVESAVDIANRFPRNLTDFVENLRALATKNQPVAQSMFYRLKRGGKTIQGESIRFAELLRLTYKNIRVSCDIIDETTTEVTARCIGHDMQANIWESSVVSRNIVGKHGRYNQDMIQQTKNAAISIVKRNVIVSLIPKALWIDVYTAAENVAAGTAKGFVQARDAMLQCFAEMDVSTDLVLGYLGKNSIEALTRSDLMDMAGIKTAIDEHQTTVDQAFRAEPRAKLQAEADTLTSGNTGTSGTVAEATPPEPASPVAAAADEPPPVAPTDEKPAEVPAEDALDAEQPSEDLSPVMGADDKAAKTATISRVASLLRSSGLDAKTKRRLLVACFDAKTNAELKALDIENITEGGALLDAFFASPAEMQQIAVDGEDLRDSIEDMRVGMASEGRPDLPF